MNNYLFIKISKKKIISIFNHPEYGLKNFPREENNNKNYYF